MSMKRSTSWAKGEAKVRDEPATIHLGKSITQAGGFFIAVPRVEQGKRPEFEWKQSGFAQRLDRLLRRPSHHPQQAGGGAPCADLPLIAVDQDRLSLPQSRQEAAKARPQCRDRIPWTRRVKWNTDPANPIGTCPWSDQTAIGRQPEFRLLQQAEHGSDPGMAPRCKFRARIGSDSRARGQQDSGCGGHAAEPLPVHVARPHHR